MYGFEGASGSSGKTETRTAANRTFGDNDSPPPSSKKLPEGLKRRNMPREDDDGKVGSSSSSQQHHNDEVTEVELMEMPIPTFTIDSDEEDEIGKLE